MTLEEGLAKLKQLEAESIEIQNQLQAKIVEANQLTLDIYGMMPGDQITAEKLIRGTIRVLEQHAQDVGVILPARTEGGVTPIPIPPPTPPGPVEVPSA